MHEHAEVIRLEAQLTVPTRNRAHLSDLWIAIAARTRLTEWAEGFEAVAVSHNVPATAAGRLQLVPMSDRQGWIVARGVDLSLYSPADIEAIVRGLVARVNGSLESPLAIAGSAPSATSWSDRIRSAVHASGNAAKGMVTDTRGRVQVDASARG